MSVLWEEKKTQKTRHTSFITFTSDFFGSLGTIFDRSIGLKKSIWRPKMSPSKFGECETGSSVVLNIGFTLATGFPFESLRIFAASDRLIGPLLLLLEKKTKIFKSGVASTWKKTNNIGKAF